MGLHAILIDSCPEGLPSTACHDCCSRDQLQEWRALSKARGAFWSLTAVESVWSFFPQRRKAEFSEMGERYSLRWVSSLPFWEWVLLLMEKGKTALQDLGPVGPVKWHLPSCRHSCSSIPDGSRKKQKPEQGAGGSHNPTRETKNKTDSTEKVERLRDNQRGLSVVIYNRDCKMVN